MESRGAYSATKTRSITCPRARRSIPLSRLPVPSQRSESNRTNPQASPFGALRRAKKGGTVVDKARRSVCAKTAAQATAGKASRSRRGDPLMADACRSDPRCPSPQHHTAPSRPAISFLGFCSLFGLANPIHVFPRLLSPRHASPEPAPRAPRTFVLPIPLAPFDLVVLTCDRDGRQRSKNDVVSPRTGSLPRAVSREQIAWETESNQQQERGNCLASKVMNCMWAFRRFSSSLRFSRRRGRRGASNAPARAGRTSPGSGAEGSSLPASAAVEGGSAASVARASTTGNEETIAATPCSSFRALRARAE